MGKHKKHRQPEENIKPNNLNQNALTNMLNNIDVNQLSSMLSTLNSNGLNLNNLDLNDIKLTDNDSSKDVDNEKTIQLLKSLKPFLSPKRGQIIDTIIEMYLSGEFDE